MADDSNDKTADVKEQLEDGETLGESVDEDGGVILTIDTDSDTEEDEE